MVELAPLPSPGFYSCLFVVMKTSGSWRPEIDLSTLNLRVLKSLSKMEIFQSVLLLVRHGDWMVSLDLNDAYLPVPVHPDSCKYLRFVALGKVFQFKGLCFCLSTAPQVFTRVTAPVSSFLHRFGIRNRWYLNDWLIQTSSRDLVLQALNCVLQLCHTLEIMVNEGKSNLVPSQRIVYQGTVLDSRAFRASPSQPRVEKLLLIGEFLSSNVQPESSWQVLLWVLCSLTHLVLRGHLHLRSHQLLLHRSWDRLDDSALVRWDSACCLDLLWWLDQPHLEAELSLSLVSPDLSFWSDASDVGWGAHLAEEVALGLWSPKEVDLSINARQLLAVERGGGASNFSLSWSVSRCLSL